MFSFGVKHLVVAMNKMDTVDWDEQRFGFVRNEVLQFLVKVKQRPFLPSPAGARAPQHPLWLLSMQHRTLASHCAARGFELAPARGGGGALLFVVVVVSE